MSRFSFEENKRMKNDIDLNQRDYILMSLLPDPYQQIKSGTKKYEYRKRYRKNATKAFIYVSRSTKEISAIIEFGKPIIDEPEVISELAEQNNPGTGKGIYEYLRDFKEGYAIPVLSFQEIEPVSLKELRDLFPGFTVPQSYLILNKKPELLSFLLNRKRLTENINQS
jgi:predicted transcriptional regulator